MRSRRVAAPKGRAVRPTPARVKEALFSILAREIPGARVLDMYAGSGALGFEALSRGAEHVTFIEADAATARMLRESAARLGAAGRCKLLVGPAERALARLGGRYDIVFADPPYASGVAPAILAGLRERGLIDTDSVFVYEHGARAPLAVPAGYDLVRSAVYGSVALSFLRSQPARVAHG